MSLVQFENRALTVSQRTGEITALTSLRGIAAVAVLLLHFRDQFGADFNPDRFTLFFARSYLFVDFFFILSGFVIAFSYAHMFTKGIVWRDYGAFLIKRLARIYPLHIVVLAGFVASEVAKYFIATNANPPFSVNTGAALLANVFLVQSWGLFDHYTWNHPAWSISTEWFAYLLFPVLILILSRLRGMTQALLVASACGALLLVFYYLIPEEIAPGYFLLRCVPSFVLGILVFLCPRFLAPRVMAHWAGDTAFSLALAAAFLCVLLPLPDMTAILAFFFVVLAGSLNRGAVARVLSARPVYFLGMISYSIYLVHTLVLRVWQMIFQVVWHGHMRLIEALFAFAFMMAAVLIASTLSYYLVEAPGRDYFGRFARRRTRPVVVPATAGGPGAV